MENLSGQSGLNIDKYRVSLEDFGIMLGKQMYTVGVKNVDPKYNEKLRGGAPVVNRPIKMFILNKVDIKGISAEIDGSGCPVVIFNPGSKDEMRFPITKPEFKDVAVATVREAIQAAEDGRQPIFFKDCERLTKELISLNTAERNRANDVAKDAAMQASLLDDLMANQLEEQRNYFASLKMLTEVEINVNVTEQ